jgi:hypothetical protein
LRFDHRHRLAAGSTQIKLSRDSRRVRFPIVRSGVPLSQANIAHLSVSNIDEIGSSGQGLNRDFRSSPVECLWRTGLPCGVRWKTGTQIAPERNFRRPGNLQFRAAFQRVKTYRR